MEQIIFLLILAALAVGKHFLENAGSGGAGDDDEPVRPAPRQRPPVSRPQPGLPGSEDSEEERMRRFMEALGLPASAPVPKPKPQPPVGPVPPTQQPSAPVPQAQPQPPRRVRPDYRKLGEPVFRKPAPRRIPAPLQPAQPIQPIQPAHPVAPALEPLRPVKSAPTSETAPAMQVTSLDQIDVPEAGRAVESAAAGVESATRPSLARQSPSPSGKAAALLREDLRDPASLRRAILLREILGPPKGLQSASVPSILHLP